MSDLASPSDFLAAAYTQLAFERGALLLPLASPNPKLGRSGLRKATGNPWQPKWARRRFSSWIAILLLCLPRSEDGSGEVLKKLYERIWCMSRPQLLFLASPGQLVVL